MNSVNISGRMVRDPDIRRTTTGSSVANFTVAVKRPGTTDIVDYHDCVAWDKLADKVAAEYKQGNWIEISGILITHSNEKDGVKRRYVEVRVETAGHAGECPD